MSTQTGNQKENKKLSNLIDYYEVCNQSESNRFKTVTWYTANLRHFYHYLKSRHLPDSIDKIDVQVIREYTLYLLKKSRFVAHPYTPAQNPFA